MKITKLKLPILLVVLGLSVPVMLLVTNPENLPLPLLILPLALVFATLFIASLLIITKIRPGIKKRKSRVIAALLAALPTVIMVLQSIEQLSLRDVTIVTGLWMILGWYLVRIDFA